MSKYKVGDVLYNYKNKGELKKSEVQEISYDHYSEEWTIDLKDLDTGFEWFDAEEWIKTSYFFSPEEALKNFKEKLQAKISYNLLEQQRLDKEKIELEKLLKGL